MFLSLVDLVPRVEIFQLRKNTSKTSFQQLKRHVKHGGCVKNVGKSPKISKEFQGRLQDNSLTLHEVVAGYDRI